jgi:transcriptional regulator
MEISMDINATFQSMENKRYVKVLKWILVGGYNSEEVAKMLDTTESNVYNIKHRAIVQFAHTYNAC